MFARFKHTSPCLEIRCPHTQTLEGKMTQPFDLLVPNLATFGNKFESGITCHTIAQSTCYRDDALASFVDVVRVLYKGVPSSWMGLYHFDVDKFIFVRQGQCHFWKRTLTSEWLVAAICRLGEKKQPPPKKKNKQKNPTVNKQTNNQPPPQKKKKRKKKSRTRIFSKGHSAMLASKSLRALKSYFHPGSFNSFASFKHWPLTHKKAVLSD